METSFVFILIFLFWQRYDTSSNATMITSSNVTCIERERESLLIFKRSLRDRLNRLSSWNGVKCCEWQGIRCDRRNGHVVKLNLRTPASIKGRSLYTENLGGELSPSLLNLNHLRYLDLSVNNFSGQIPEFLGSFKFLEYLNLSCSGFGGVVPRHLGNLSRLQYLDLTTYYGESLLLNDDLSWVSSLSSLKYLDLSRTFIGDNIDWLHPVNTLPSLLTLNLASCNLNIHPIKFVNFTSLNSLDLSSNAIDSTIPVWLSNLTDLMHLNLQNNYFHGRIPDVIGTLNSLASIDLSSNSFDTSLPDLLWNLSSLVHLDLSSNKFHGPVPRNVKLCRLSFLNLQLNRFVGDFSSFIGNLSDCLINSLKDLNLEDNQFKGSVPKKIGDFKKLEHLYLSENKLSGPLPPSLSGLLSLRELDVGNNQLNGSIPASFGRLSMLEKLYLSGNRLSGNIPMSFGQLSKLDTLDVSYNSLVGILSESHFTKMKSLTILTLHSNSLTFNISSQWIPPFQLQKLYGSSCNIGPNFPNWLHTQTNLQILDLSNASIVDTLPEWFVNISSHIYYMDLSYNQIGGKLPRFHAFSNLQPFRILILNSNKFEGSFTSFPSNLYQLDLSDNLLSGHVPQTDKTMNSDLVLVNLSNNYFTGSVPIHLCNVFGIEVLDLSNNKFSGRLPECLGNLYGLIFIDLSNNTITGVVPSSLGSLRNLQSLHLHNNRLEGDLPVSLQNLASLLTMDLGNNLLNGTIPFWNGENLPNLQMLNLQSNKFSGKIPLQLCQLQTLQYLNLADNNISGTIPRCFGNLSGMIMNHVERDHEDSEESIINFIYNENILASMKGRQLQYTMKSIIPSLTALDLSSNNICGEIPDGLMNLDGLQSLNLSRNLLKGKIPMMIGNLNQIESLDFSINKLSGRIPQSLTSLNFLSYLNLSFNNLTGEIPVGNQLQTLDNPFIYEGNSGLCGPPLSRSCHKNNSSFNRVEENEGQDDTEYMWFLYGMGPGFVAGFIGILGSLHFIRSWRVAYFKSLENFYCYLMLSILLNLARLRRKLFK